MRPLFTNDCDMLGPHLGQQNTQTQTHTDCDALVFFAAFPSATSAAHLRTSAAPMSWVPSVQGMGHPQVYTKKQPLDLIRWVVVSTPSEGLRVALVVSKCDSLKSIANQEAHCSSELCCPGIFIGGSATGMIDWVTAHMARHLQPLFS